MWIGFGLMMVGVLVAAVGRRGPRKKRAIEGFVAPAAAGAEPTPQSAPTPQAEPEKLD